MGEESARARGREGTLRPQAPAPACGDAQVRAVFSQVRLPVSIRQNPHQPAANHM